MTDLVEVPTAEAFAALAQRVAALEQAGGQPGGNPAPAECPVLILRSEVWWSGDIAITDGNSQLWYACRRLHVNQPKAGEDLTVFGQAAFRNDTGWNVELASTLAYVEDVAPAGYSGSAAFGGVKFSTINGKNVTPGEHYGSPVNFGTFTVPNDAPVASILLCLRARCSAANGNQVLVALSDLMDLIAFRTP